MAPSSWSKLTQTELRAILRSHCQPTHGLPSAAYPRARKAVLVQRVAALMSAHAESSADAVHGESDGAAAGAGPSESTAAQLEEADASTELAAWRSAAARVNDATAALAEARTAMDELRQQCALHRATNREAEIAAYSALRAHCVRHNEQRCALLQLLGHDDLRTTFLRTELWGVVDLWRLRGVCCAWRSWADSVLAKLPRLLAIAGCKITIDEEELDELVEDECDVPTSTVESLDLRTMKWSVRDAPAHLATTRTSHAACCLHDGRVVVTGGWNSSTDPGNCPRSATVWNSRSGTWENLPDLPEARWNHAAIAVKDRVMLLGGFSNPYVPFRALSSVIALDMGPGQHTTKNWITLQSMSEARVSLVSTALASGEVFAAAGARPLDPQPDDYHGGIKMQALSSTEIYSPDSDVWSTLPPMSVARKGASCSVLPSGRVAVFGGVHAEDSIVDSAANSPNNQVVQDGEVFDPVLRTWEHLPTGALMQRMDAAATAVPGGLVVVGGELLDKFGPDGEDLLTFLVERNQAQLFDESSEQWYKLPHDMVEPRAFTQVVVDSLAQQPTQ